MNGIDIILKKARRIVSDIEGIVEQHYGWIEFVEGRLIAHTAYDSLIEYKGAQSKERNRIDNRTFRIPFIWMLWPIAKLFYHIFVSKFHIFTKPNNTNEISNAILILPGVRSFPHLLSRLEVNLKESYSCISMTVTANNVPWEIKQLLNTNLPPHIEEILSFSDVFWFIRAMLQVAKSRSDFIRDIQERIFSKYNINNPRLTKGIINSMFYSIFDNIEYGLIGKKIARHRPRALISEVANYGKIAYIMSYVRKKNILTIGIQHGVMIDPFEYLPASEYFGCPSKYALKKLEELKNCRKRKSYYFLCGLPEQMTSKEILTEHRMRNVGLVDSNERIQIYKRQSVEILQKSKSIHKLPVLYIKSHPRAYNTMKVENWLTLPNFKSMGISNWDDFCRGISIAITLSFDAIYELLKRKIVTIVLNPLNIFGNNKIRNYNNLRFVHNSVEIDVILSDIIDNKVAWDETEENVLGKYMDYIFGEIDNELYVKSIIKILNT